jgi:hypothetical protein
MNIGLILHLMFQTQSDPDKEYPELQDKQVVDVVSQVAQGAVQIRHDEPLK